MRRIPKKRFIEAAWLSYRETSVPTDASAEQVNESRKTFFAGATVLMSTMGLILTGSDDDERELTAAEEESIDDIHAELDEFGAQLDPKILAMFPLYHDKMN